MGKTKSSKGSNGRILQFNRKFCGILGQKNSSPSWASSPLTQTTWVSSQVFTLTRRKCILTAHSEKLKMLGMSLLFNQFLTSLFQPRFGAERISGKQKLLTRLQTRKRRPKR